MKIFLIVLVVMLIIAFRDKIVSFFRGFNAEKEIKEDGSIVIGPYVITPVKVVWNNYYSNDCSRIEMFTFDNGRTIARTVSGRRNLWQYIGRDKVCSRVQEFNSNGLLVSDNYLPVPPENVCYRMWSCKPYYRR